MTNEQAGAPKEPRVAPKTGPCEGMSEEMMSCCAGMMAHMMTMCGGARHDGDKEEATADGMRT